MLTFRRMLAVAVLLGAAHATGAQPLSEAVQRFDEGNQRYAAGDYAAALEAYAEAEAAGFTSGALFYNMGNAHYRLDHLGQAIRYYEKARRLMPEQRELLHNLEIARAQTRDQFSRVPPPFWRAPWRALVRAVGAGGLFAAGALFYLIAIGLVGYRIWTGVRSAWHRRALTLSLLAGLFLLGLAYAASLTAVLDRQAVVVVRAEPLRTDPSSDADAEITIHEGLLLDVLGQRGDWAEVRLPNGITGWVSAETLAEV